MEAVLPINGDHAANHVQIPTSTTRDTCAARRFCGDNGLFYWYSSVLCSLLYPKGIVLKSAPKYTNEVDNSQRLDVSELSEFKGEKERLVESICYLLCHRIESDDCIIRSLQE